MTSVRVLFVDDEPRILEGLRHRLHRQRAKWQMFFVESGAAALDLMAREPIDVIVSDMRMPEMDGATLLKKVQELFPHVVRIVLSGHAEAETALRAVAVAHQYLSKPCEAGVIENVVERARNLQSLINGNLVKQTVGKIKTLPAVPQVYSKLMALVVKETASTAEVAGVLRQDMAICAKILQIVNSAFFGLARAISEVESAVTYLGFTTIKQVALAVEVFHCLPIRCHPAVAPEVLQKHAVLVGSLASSFFVDKKKKEDAFVAGLLHDIGKLLLAAELPEYVSKVMAEMDKTGCSMHIGEQSVWGVTHGELGAYLLGLWGLPYVVVEAVANHHLPSRVDSSEFGSLAAAHIADSLVNDEAHARLPNTPRQGGSLDMAYVEKLGLMDKLEGWRRLAREKMGTQAEHSCE